MIIVDVSDPANPSFVGSCDTPYDANSIVVSGAYAYVADADDTLIIDISNPAAPAIVGQYDTGDAWGIALDGNNVYVGDGDNGVIVLNVNDPANPVYAGSYDTVGYAGGLNIVGDLVYVADGPLVILHTDSSSTSGPVHNINKDTDYTTIQAAIDDASLGDEIHVDSGTYYENVNVNKRLTLRGIDTGAGMPVVDARLIGSAITLNADGITLEGFTATNANSYPYAGINVISNSNTLSNNSASNNSHNGIRLDSSSNNALSGNTASNNLNMGIHLYFSSNNTLSGNAVSNNFNPGIGLLSSSNNTLIGNIASNTRTGIYLYSSSNNMLSGNTASNQYYGIYLYSSSSNILYHNNFVDNTVDNAYDISGNNQWDWGTTGNYYSDYLGIDSNGDGIGDTPHPIPGGSSVDNYPLMVPYSPPPSDYEGKLLKQKGDFKVYLIEDGKKHHFTTPEALEWNGYSFDDVIEVSEDVINLFEPGVDISINQAIIDKYNALGGEATFGTPTGTGEQSGDPDNAGVICTYVNFQNGAIEYFTNGDQAGNAYAILKPFFDKWASMGYAKSVLGYPISDMSNTQTSSLGTPFKYQNFMNGTERGALEYNLTSGEVFEIHGAIYATWSAMDYANSILGLVTSDERDAVPSFKGTTGRVSDFENGHLHWHSSGDHYMVTYMTYGDLDELFVSMGGTASWLGFPVMVQEDRDGYGYCEFEGGYIEWDGSEYKAVPITGHVHNINKGTHYTTIQVAIDDASTGDEIHVDSGTYYENVVVNKQLILRGIDTGDSLPVINAGEDIGIVIDADYVTIDGFNIINSDFTSIAIGGNSNNILNNDLQPKRYWGIVLFSNNSIVDNNRIICNRWDGNEANETGGIWIANGHFNNITNNSVSNGLWGISDASLTFGLGAPVSGSPVISVGNLIIFNNTISSSNIGIALFESNQNHIENNNISNNYENIAYEVTGTGVLLFGSNDSTIKDNLITENEKHGIALYHSYWNVLYENNVENNLFGVALEGSNDNKFYHNNFYNTVNAVENGSNNIWDDGYPSGGNFWNDYVGIDQYSGPNQNEPDYDGIGDTSHPIPEITNGIVSSEDRYPLIAPNSPPPSDYEGKLLRQTGDIKVYLIEDGKKRHFTSPEALEWDGYSFIDVIEVSVDVINSFELGADISITQTIIDKYNALGGAATFGPPAGTGEQTGYPDNAGVICTYVNFQNGAIEYFTNGDQAGNAYAILNPFFDKWASMGYAKSVLGYPISDMSDTQNSSLGTPFKYQNFINGTEKGALEYNLTTGEVFEIHGAIYATWSAMGYANSILGLVTSDERDAVPSFKGTTGRVSDFENGHLHWHSSGDHYMVTYMTYGDLDELYVSMGGTASWLGFPVMHQEDRGGYGYCEFEGGYIEWDGSEYKALLTTGQIHNINKGTHYTTIQAAIDDASLSDEIHVDSGTYYENVVINKQLILRGIDTGTGMPVVDAGGSGNVVTISADGCILNGFIITNSGLLDVNAGLIITSNDNVIKNNDVSSNKAGISLESSNNNAIEGNIVNFNSYPGIALTSSNDNIISHNEVNSNGYYGIELYLSSNNTLIGNIANSNTRYGIFVWKSDNDNRLISNTANTNDYAGIRFHTSSNNEVSDNLLVSNIEYGISMYGSNGNIISENNASFSKNGIYLDSSSNNMIYHNNIIKNTNQAFDNLGPNTWDNGYPSGGNNWSDYIEVDIKSGPNQDQPGRDGIGDTSYTIPSGSSVDRYPLMVPYTRSTSDYEGKLIQQISDFEVYLIEDGKKRHFTSPEALEWNGHSFDDVIEVSQEILDSFEPGTDISITEVIINKYNNLGGEATFGTPAGTGEQSGDPDSLGAVCSYVNFQNGAIEYFTNGDQAGNAYAILNPFFNKWASMGYANSVLGYPISDMSDVQTSSLETPFKYQNFMNGIERGALEYNLTSGAVFEIHGAIYATWGAIGYAKSVLGAVTSDELPAGESPPPHETTGKYSKFENGTIHWISYDNSGHPQNNKAFITSGDLDEFYTGLGGTNHWLGFPVMNQTEVNGHGYCEFEGGYIEWDGSGYKAYSPNTPPSTLHVKGVVKYSDITYTNYVKPFKYAKIEIDNDQDPINGNLGTGNSMSDGSFDIIINNIPTDIIFLRIYTDSEGHYVDKVRVNKFNNKDVYYFEMEGVKSTYFHITLDSIQSNIYADLFTAYDYFKDKEGLENIEKITVNWGNIENGAYYNGQISPTIVVNYGYYSFREDRNIVMYHEYGHFVMDSYHGIIKGFKDNENVYGDKSVNAWIEGWATFASALIHGDETIRKMVKMGGKDPFLASTLDLEKGNMYYMTFGYFDLLTNLNRKKKNGYSLNSITRPSRS